MNLNVRFRTLLFPLMPLFRIFSQFFILAHILANGKIMTKATCYERQIFAA